MGAWPKSDDAAKFFDDVERENERLKEGCTHRDSVKVALLELAERKKGRQDMARKWLLLIVLGFTLIFSSCITTYTPKESVVELASRGTQTFTAVSDDATARLVWYLDGRRVSYGQSRYTFNAEQNDGTAIITHQVTVREEGGKYAMYYKYSGTPAPSVTWTIRVMPPSLPEPCYLDEDGDGYGDIAKMVQTGNPPANCLKDKSDCNDDDESVYPGAAEVCGDGLDQDCSGADEACPADPNDVDDDGDGVTENQGDCNDASPTVHPGAAEVCGDGIDQDCNGADAVCPPDPNDVDDDGDGLTENQGDCNDADAEIYPGAAETCGDGIDQDCSGDDAACPPGPNDTDDDGDSYTENEGDCNDGDAGIFPGANDVCGDGIDQDCSGGDEICPPDPSNSDDDNDGYTENQGDCNDSNPAVHPGAAEICNNLDDNCNGQTDEGVQASFYRDADGDTYGNPAVAVQACVAPSGYVADHSDCDDAVATVHPNALEICNTIDEDCDGQIDEGVLLTFYQDGDRDSFGNAAITTQACAAPNGYVASGSDCDDTRDTVHPGAAEVCNNLDDNCNGAVDDGIASQATSCGIGACASAGELACTGGSMVDSCQPGMPSDETCDGIDNNCNGAVDEGVQLTFYRDGDGDTYGNAGITTQGCSAPSGYVDNGTDCDDTVASTHPAALEACNQTDDNCDGAVDEGDVCAAAVPAAPTNVQATDITSGRTDILVTWSASTDAAFYRVYRAVYNVDGNFIPVSGDIVGTSFVYTQDFTADVIDQVGAFPQGDDYLLNLEAYREEIKPYLFNFKAPAFFRVEACNADGDCSDLSAADAGQAEFIHTAAYSEVAQVMIPLWFHPILVTFGSLPPGADALSWCGIDICGPAGGMYMGRLNGNTYTPQLDVYYENYTDGWMNHQAARFWADGYIGGMQRGIFSNPILKISGNFDATFGGIQSHLFAYFAIPLLSGENDGYVTVTYNGAAYQFMLPINAETAALAPLAPLDAARNDADYTIGRNDTAYPVPFAEEALTDCPLWSEDLVVQCNRIQ